MADWGRYINGQQLWPLWPVRVELEKLLRKKDDLIWDGWNQSQSKLAVSWKCRLAQINAFDAKKKKKLNPSWTFSLPRQCIAELLSGSNCQGVQLLMAARWCSLRAGADLVHATRCRDGETRGDRLVWTGLPICNPNQTDISPPWPPEIWPEIIIACPHNQTTERSLSCM